MKITDFIYSQSSANHFLLCFLIKLAEQKTTLHNSPKTEKNPANENNSIKCNGVLMTQCNSILRNGHVNVVIIASFMLAVTTKKCLY